jgi:hypothetical protein
MTEVYHRLVGIPIQDRHHLWHREPSHEVAQPNQHLVRIEALLANVFERLPGAMVVDAQLLETPHHQWEFNYRFNPLGPRPGSLIISHATQNFTVSRLISKYLHPTAMVCAISIMRLPAPDSCRHWIVTARNNNPCRAARAPSTTLAACKCSFHMPKPPAVRAPAIGPRPSSRSSLAS